MTITLSDARDHAFGSAEGLGAIDAELAFAARFPEFDPDGSFSALRRREYGRLDANDQVYLDYTGGGLHATSQVDAQLRAPAQQRAG